MKVLVPLNESEHINEYIKAGAEEFYLGFYDTKWEAAFGEFADLNRMSGYKKRANQYTFEKLKDLIHQVKSKGKKIYITFNASLYAEKQLSWIKKYFEELKTLKVDGVIVSGTDLVQMAEEVGLPAVVSTIAGVYNSDLARFYTKLGAKRIILPRDLSVAEIKSIVHNVPQVEYEVFMMRNGCRFSDSHCLGLHRNEHCGICAELGKSTYKLDMKVKDFKTQHDAELNDLVYNKSFHQYACGLCALYKFEKLGIAAYKIVGRSDEWQSVVQDIKLIHQNIELIKTCHSQEEYLERMQFPEERFVMCKLGLSCYYPEIRF